MTTEEIENLVNNLVEEYERYKDDLTIKNYIKRVIEITNLHWQEKTKWIPVKERLPKVRKTPFFIIVQGYDNSDKFKANVETFLIRDEIDVIWVRMNCKYWKEIE